MAKRVYENSKDQILETAKKILLEEGIGKFSTDNLIAKSGLSKGGFFYHFKTKNDLIQALSLRILEEMDAGIAELASKDSQKKGATLRAYINYTLSEKSDEMIALCRSLIEVLIDKSHDVTPYTQFGKALLKKMQSEGTPKENIMAVFFALDGYWYNEVFGVQMFSKTETRKYIKSLLRYAD